MILSKAEDLQSLEGHITRETTYEDPRQTASQRTVYLYRDPNIGYGFVAASQRPVVVQFVSPAGPSSGKLFVNDQILNVNGVNVEDADKENVVDLIRKSSTQLTLIVSQVPSCQVRFFFFIHTYFQRIP
ncbi:FERM and PDZ domain-containing protein 4 [Toxocara canis]|uniref:FERM and PDZ domain-containing protein 4 n=1 Tax=Toxocara canis TaxID=6265 RepID=A0A0B2VEU5_TOXCA|nr:FERM and PDZ domain-containing protein 4 [Toxocara canis]